MAETIHVWKKKCVEIHVWKPWKQRTHKCAILKKSKKTAVRAADPFMILKNKCVKCLLAFQNVI